MASQRAIFCDLLVLYETTQRLMQQQRQRQHIQLRKSIMFMMMIRQTLLARKMMIWFCCCRCFSSRKGFFNLWPTSGNARKPLEQETAPISSYGVFRLASVAFVCYHTGSALVSRWCPETGALDLFVSQSRHFCLYLLPMACLNLSVKVLAPS